MQPTDQPIDNDAREIALPQGSDLNVVALAVLAFFSLGLWLGVVGQLVFYVPRSQDLFDEFKMKLPSMTDLVIRHFWWMVPGLIVATLAACLVSRSRLAWLVLLLALPIFLNVVIFFSMYLPTQALLEGLNK